MPCEHFQVALNNFKHANLDGKIRLILGAAKDTIKTLQPAQPFDLIFIDADKPGNLDYFIEAKRLIRKGGVIIGSTSASDLDLPSALNLYS